jgi:hypothetical protein
MNYATKLIIGLAATLLLAVFVFGLAQSIATGFAGFWGGLPFIVITVLVVGMAFIDFWDECVRRRK